MKRAWGIRHLRYWGKLLCFLVWWRRVGRHLGAYPNHRDMDHLEAVWRGDE